MKVRSVIVNGLTIVAAAAVGVFLSPDAALATTGTDLDTSGTTATTIVKGIGGLMMALGIGATGIMWPVYKMNALWAMIPSVGGGVVTAKSDAIAQRFGGGAAFDWNVLHTVDWNAFYSTGSF